MRGSCRDQWGVGGLSHFLVFPVGSVVPGALLSDGVGLPLDLFIPVMQHTVPLLCGRTWHPVGSVPGTPLRAPTVWRSCYLRGAPSPLCSWGAEGSCLCDNELRHIRLMGSSFCRDATPHLRPQHYRSACGWGTPTGGWRTLSQQLTPAWVCTRWTPTCPSRFPLGQNSG